MNALRKGLLPLLLAGAMFTQSCKEASTTGPGTTDPVVNTKPTNGSTYTFYSKTTNGSTVKNEDTVVYTVSLSPTAIKGKSDVYVFSSSDVNSDDRTIAYESNGNISVLVPVITTNTQDVQWMTIPVSSSGGSSNMLVSDFEIDLFGTVMRTVVKVGATFVANENIMVGTKSYAAKKVKTTSTSTVTVQGQTTTGTDDDFFWWIPELGYYGKLEEGGQVDPSTQTADDLKTETLVRASVQ